MKSLTNTLTSLWNSRPVRAKLLATIALTVLFRFLAHVPLQGVDRLRLSALFQSNELLGVLNIFSGGTLEQFSIMAVGISPYITASIVVQVAGFFFPKVKEMQRESEATRAQLTQITRLLTVPIAVIQSTSMLLLLRSQNLLTATAPQDYLTMILSLVAGAMVVMWIGELLTRHGVGNGMSWVIFVGIVSQLPLSLMQTWSLRDVVGANTILLYFLGLATLVVSVVFMTESVRQVPMQQARRQRGADAYGVSVSYLPIKVLQFGVMPMIFALPILTIPATIAPFILSWKAAPEWLVEASRVAQIWFGSAHPVYQSLYFLLVFAFTFFSIFIYFQPKDFADDLKKSGTYVPGVRPGKPTADFLTNVLLRVSFVGGAYLGIIALLPLLAQNYTGINTMSIGGTGLLIVVSVVLETVREVKGQLVHDQYDRYI